MPQTAVILAGGTVAPDMYLSALEPKLLLPIANVPLAHYLASTLRAVGVRRLIVSLDSGSSKAVERLSDAYRGSDLQIEYVIQEVPRGTGGSLKEVESRLRGDSFLVVSGNLLLGTDLREMLASHWERGALATVGVFRVPEPPWEMERVELDAKRRVKAIHRIHPAQNKRSTLRPAGLYLFEPAVLKLIPERGHFDLKEQLFSLLAERGMSAEVWEIPAYCRIISSVSDYFSVNRDALLGRIRPPQVPGGPLPEGTRHPEISASATVLEPVVVGLGSRIEEGAKIIGPTVIGEDCDIEANAILDECVVLGGVRVGSGARLERCILGESSTVEEGAVLREMIVLDQPVHAGDMLVFPGKHLPLDASGIMKPLGWRSARRKAYLAGKRAVDVVLSAITLLVLTPLMCLIALAITLDSPGGVIFRQRRCGRRGREFTMYKFRSMVADAEELKRGLRNEGDGPMFKIIGDPRSTRLGRLLRATNLDELPQLWNVLRGDMSLVGPRPLSMDEMRYSARWKDFRLSVRPGLTGLWQVRAHDKVSFAEWIRCDLRYVRNMSLWLDLKILFWTLLKAFRLEETRRR